VGRIGSTCRTTLAERRSRPERRDGRSRSKRRSAAGSPRQLFRCFDKVANAERFVAGKFRVKALSDDQVIEDAARRDDHEIPTGKTRARTLRSYGLAPYLLAPSARRNPTVVVHAPAHHIRQCSRYIASMSNVDHIARLLAHLADPLNFVWGHPTTGIDLLEDGSAEIESPKAPRELIDALFRQRHTMAIARTPSLPGWLDVNEVSLAFLSAEIQECVLFGCNGAAITLSCLLIERALKLATAAKLTKDHRDLLGAEIAKREGKDLLESIVEAERHGLLSSSEASTLKDFTIDVRNVYLHYSIERLTKGRKLPVTETNTKTGQVTELDEVVDGLPDRQAIVKRLLDQNSVDSIVRFAHDAVRRVFAKLDAEGS